MKVSSARGGRKKYLNKEKKVLFFCLDTKEPKGQDCKINAKIISILRWNK
jgi:hypothetical protein